MKASSLVFSYLMSLLFAHGTILASVIGVAPRAALLQQLQLGLEIKLKDYNLPSYLTTKLPTGNRPELMTSTFMSAWTQLTYSVCKQAVVKGQVPPNLSTPDSIKKWLTKISVNSWSTPSQANEIQTAYDAGFNSANTGLPQNVRLALSCSYVLSSPNVYATTAH